MPTKIIISYTLFFLFRSGMMLLADDDVVIKNRLVSFVIVIKIGRKKTK